MEKGALLVKIERLKRNLANTDDSAKRLRLSKELDKLLNRYYIIKNNESFQ